jgi:hypothetical protein
MSQQNVVNRFARKLFGLGVALAVILPLTAVIATTPATAAPLACPSPGTLVCLQFTNANSPNLAIDVADPNNPHDYLKMVAGNQESSYWRLEQNPDFTFRIRNLKTNNCIDVWRTNMYLDQWECEGQSSQKWYLVPTSGTANTHMIRQVDTGNCFVLDDVWVWTGACDAANTQQAWNIGVSGIVPGARPLAIKYAMASCDKDPASCNWKEDSTKTAAFTGPAACVSDLVRNTSGTNATFSRTWKQTVGWQNMVGGSLSLAVTTGFSLGVEAEITAEIQANYAHTWIGSEEVSDTVTFTLGNGQYGWITRAPLLKKVTGTWTLFVGSHRWTSRATITLPAKDGTDAKQSVVQLKTATTPPTNC